MIELKREVKEILEKHIILIENNEWDEFFEIIQNEWIPQVIGKVAETLESVGIFPLKYTTFIPEGYFTLSPITEYTIPKNITRICYKAFYASDIEKIVIPSNVLDINKDAFEGCDFLEKVTLDEGVKYIHDGCFYACDVLESVILPKTLLRLGHNVFNGCGRLTQISYRGTIANWNRVANREFVNEGSYISKIICSDGVIDL